MLNTAKLSLVAATALLSLSAFAQEEGHKGFYVELTEIVASDIPATTYTLKFCEPDNEGVDHGHCVSKKIDLETPTFFHFHRDTASLKQVKIQVGHNPPEFVDFDAPFADCGVDVDVSIESTTYGKGYAFLEIVGQIINEEQATFNCDNGSIFFPGN